MARRVFCVKDGAPAAPSECPEDLKPLEEDDCDTNCTLSADGSGDNATEVTSGLALRSLFVKVDTGEEEECEYYDDWWIFGADGSGSGEEEEEEETKKRRRRQAEGSGEEGSGDEAEADDSASEAGGEGGNGTVASGDGGNSTKKEIDLSIFSKRCKPEPVGLDYNAVGLPTSSRWSHVGTQPLAVVQTSSMLLRAPSRKVASSTRHVRTPGRKVHNALVQLLFRFGCCRDGHTMATGLAFAGCPTGVCEKTLFGCCDDGETPASALPKAAKRRRRQAEESGDGSGEEGEAEAEDAGASGDGAENEDTADGGSGDAADGEESDEEDATMCEENKKCKNGKFGKYSSLNLFIYVNQAVVPMVGHSPKVQRNRAALNALK